MNTLHIEDFVTLGRTVPEESRRYGKRVCMAGYSPGINQFLRVYPLMVPVGEHASANGFRARCVYSMDLRRNEHDNRIESWRLVDENRPTSTAWDKAVEVRKSELIKWLSGRVVDSIAVLNSCRLSLGVLRLEANNWKGTMLRRGENELTEADATLFDDLEGDEEIDPNRINHIPYIGFRDNCGEHRLQVREWGAYRLLVQPKYAENPDVLWSAPGYRLEHDLLVIVGNMCNYRTNWLIIKTFELEKPDSGPSLFSGHT